MYRMLLFAGWLLPCILVLLFFIKGRSYDPAFFTPPSMISAFPFPLTLKNWMLEGGEFLPADRMFEKINGKAGYYLQYGATGLYSGEWIAPDDQRWDMYLYQFEEGQGARRAYSGERPSDGFSIEGMEGYIVPGQAALVAGAFYLQLNAQTAKADAAPAVELAGALAAYFGGGASEEQAEAVIDLAMLAADAGTGEAEQFLPESAFGFSMFNEVRTIRVVLDGAETVWFTAPGDAETVAAYAKELATYGGEELFSENGGTGGSMFGSWGMAGELDGAVWGVQNASSREALLQQWNVLKQRVQNQ